MMWKFVTSFMQPPPPSQPPLQNNNDGNDVVKLLVQNVHDAEKKVKETAAELGRQNPKNATLCLKLIEALRSHQLVVLQNIEQLFQNTQGGMPNRQYRWKFRGSEHESYSAFHGQTYFAAEVLRVGGLLENNQIVSKQLRPAAVLLGQRLSALLECEMIKGKGSALNQLNQALRSFDSQWQVFEFSYMEAFLTPHEPRLSDLLIDYTIWMAETLRQAVADGHVNPIEIEDFEPSLLIAVPRLTWLFLLADQSHHEQLTALVELSGISPKEDIQNLIEMLASLSEDDLQNLRRRLWLEEDDNSSIQALYLSICATADKLHASQLAPDLRLALKGAFRLNEPVIASPSVSTILRGNNHCNRCHKSFMANTRPVACQICNQLYCHACASHTTTNAQTKATLIICRRCYVLHTDGFLD